VGNNQKHNGCLFKSCLTVIYGRRKYKIVSSLPSNFSSKDLILVENLEIFLLASFDISFFLIHYQAICVLGINISIKGVTLLNASVLLDE